VAAYQSLTGVDVFYWFGTGEAEWSNQDRAPWDSASRAKWAIGNPMVLGQFPAAALLFRKHYLKEGEPVIEEFRSLDQIWRREPPVLAEDPGYDPNRDSGDTARRSSGTRKADPLAFLVGPVKVEYTARPIAAKVADLGRFIDSKAKVIRGNTGQVRFDYGRGVCTIDAPGAAGASGFLKKRGIVETSSVTVDSQNEYASVLVVSLDGGTLSQSRSVLVQVGTRARPTGWVERSSTFKGDGGKQTFHGKQVVSTGAMPWAIEETRIRLKIKNSGLRTAILLDSTGNARGTLQVAAGRGVIELELPRDAMYVVLKADGASGDVSQRDERR
jgi:hypothetical protein